MIWFYVNNGEATGPISDEELLSKLKLGAILPATLVWRDGMKDWKPAESVAASLSPTPAPPRQAPEPPPLSPITASGPPPVMPCYFCTHCGNIIPADQLVRISGRAVCAYCKPQYVQQAIQGLNTPLKVPIIGNAASLAPLLPGRDLADPFTRLVAHILDSIFAYLPLMLAYVIFAFAMGLGMAANNSPQPPAAFFIAGVGFTVIAVAWVFFYWTWFIGRSGATPGMRIMSIRMVRGDRSPIRMSRALGRFVLFCAINQCTMGLANLTAFFDAERRTMIDMLCDTRVVRTSFITNPIHPN